MTSPGRLCALRRFLWHHVQAQSSTDSVANFDDVSSCSSQTADDVSSCQDDTLAHCLHWSSLVEDPLLSSMSNPTDDLLEAGSEHLDANSDQVPLLPHEDVPSPPDAVPTVPTLGPLAPPCQDNAIYDIDIRWLMEL